MIPIFFVLFYLLSLLIKLQLLIAADIFFSINKPSFVFAFKKKIINVKNLNKNIRVKLLKSSIMRVKKKGIE